MNLHPIVVHFPIAFITLYALFELVRFKKVIDKPYWFYVKAVLVIAGALGAVVGVITGDLLTEGLEDGAEPRILELHQAFAITTLVLSIISAKSYALTWWWPNKYSSFILRSMVIVPLAVILLVSITITGALGGAMVYGTTFDPIMIPVFKLLGVY